MISNLATLFFKQADQRPHQLAISIHGQNVSFSELQRRVLFLSSLLRAVEKKRPLVWLMKLSIDTYAMALAAMKEGHPFVLIDPLLAKNSALNSLRNLKDPILLVDSRILQWSLSLSGLKCFYWKSFLNKNLSKSSSCEFYEFQETDPCLISFTSGSTGIPKGVNRTHGVLVAQHLISCKYWPSRPEEIDMSTFPVVVLQNLLCGVPSILPELNFSKLETMSSTLIIQQIQENSITRLCGSPFFFEKICRSNVVFPKVTRTIVGGAPVTKTLCVEMKDAFPHAESFVVYGSTEIEPISFAPIEEVLEKQQEGSFYLGRPPEEVKIRVADNYELLVSAPHLVQSYYRNPEATARSKIRDQNGELWHRTGDLGAIDEKGGILLKGRVQDVISKPFLLNPTQPLTYLALENEIRKILQLRSPFVRVALTEKSSQLFLLADIEQLDSDELPLLEALYQRHLIKPPIFLTRKVIPVDGRHASKLDRRKIQELV